MVIIYESKTGFTKRYADMLAAKTGLKVLAASECAKVQKDDEVIFLGWMKAGKIQGLAKLRGYNVKAVCGSGTGPPSQTPKQWLQEMASKASRFFICAAAASL